MSSLSEKPPDQQRLVAYLAEQFHEPFDKIAELYEHERSELAKGARITKYLHVFAMRHVREILHEQNPARIDADPDHKEQEPQTPNPKDEKT